MAEVATTTQTTPGTTQTGGSTTLPTVSADTLDAIRRNRLAREQSYRDATRELGSALRVDLGDGVIGTRERPINDFTRCLIEQRILTNPDRLRPWLPTGTTISVDDGRTTVTLPGEGPESNRTFVIAPATEGGFRITRGDKSFTLPNGFRFGEALFNPSFGGADVGSPLEIALRNFDELAGQ
jgi:hypothetical protein